MCLACCTVSRSEIRDLAGINSHHACKRGIQGAEQCWRCTLGSSPCLHPRSQVTGWYHTLVWLPALASSSIACMPSWKVCKRLSARRWLSRLPTSSSISTSSCSAGQYPTVRRPACNAQWVPRLKDLIGTDGDRKALQHGLRQVLGCGLPWIIYNRSILSLGMGLDSVLHMMWHGCSEKLHHT